MARVLTFEFKGLKIELKLMPIYDKFSNYTSVVLEIVNKFQKAGTQRFKGRTRTTTAR